MNVMDVGVTIYLVNKVSGALGQIARQFTSTQTAAAALNARLATIGNTFRNGLIVGAGGAALAYPLIAAAKAAEEYQHQINRMNSAGLSHKEMVDSIADSWKTTNTVITSTAVENLKVISDLRSIFGKTDEARLFMPTFAKQQGAYAAVFDGKLASRSDELSFAAAKAIDMLGKVNSVAEFNSQVGQMFRATEASLGRVTPADYMTTYKYARQARFGLSDDFKYKILPELILENKGGSGVAGGVGPQIAALYRAGVQGILNKRSAQAFQQMGMVPASAIMKTTTTGTTLKGGLLGSDILAANPFQWVQQVLIPHLVNHFKINETNTDALIQASNQVFRGNQLATSLVAEMIKKRQQYVRFAGLYDKTDMIDQAYNRGLANDPKEALKALRASFKDLQTAIGKNIWPVIIPGLNMLSASIHGLALYLKDHPNIAKTATAIVAAAAGLLMLGGVILVIQAACGGLVALGVLLWPLVAAVAAIAVVVANWDKIMGYVNSHSRLFIHIAAMASKGVDNLAAALSGLLAWLGAVSIGIGKMIGSLPMMSALGADFAKAGEELNNINDLTAKGDEKYLRGKGLGDLVDAIKGPAKAATGITSDAGILKFARGMAKYNAIDRAKASSPAPLSSDVLAFARGIHSGGMTHIDKSTNNFTVHQVPGHDHDKCAKTLQRAAAGIRQAHAAGSGNSVGRPLQAGGAGRS